jgi:hypothetical protein
MKTGRFFSALAVSLFTLSLLILVPASRAQSTETTQIASSTQSSNTAPLFSDVTLVAPPASPTYIWSSSDDLDSGGNYTGADLDDPTYSENDWVHRWLRAVDTARSEQPHYVAPLITTHILLVQQFRFDTYYQFSTARVESWDYGAYHGLEIIPNTRMEVQVGIPPYMAYEAPHMPDGFGDVSIFLKFRAFSATEGKGDYFFGFFLGGEFPSSTPPIGKGHTIWTPSIGAAKGWSTGSRSLEFDVQSNFGASVPQSGTNTLGRSLFFNNVFQLGIEKHLWPEVEVNSTFFVDGPLSGDKEVFLTPGLLIGPFDIAERLHFEPGAGVQIAATQFHEYDRRWIWTVRFPF